MPYSTEQLRNLDRQHIWHPFTPMKLWLESDPLVITGADGMYLIDSDGNRYLDGVSSLWCNVHGHRVPEIDEVIRVQLGRVAHSTMLGLASEPSILLAERLMRIVPRSLKKIFYSDSGATATEIAFKMAAQYWYNIGRPEKNEFIGFAEAYHGDTVGAMSIGRMPAFHRPYFPLLFNVHFAPTPYVYRPAPVDGVVDPVAASATPPTTVGGVADPAPSSPSPGTPGEGRGEGPTSDLESVKRSCLAALERILQEHAPRLAAICIEPIVQGAGGMIVHPEGFLREVRRLATQYHVLLIADEVAVGFGRTGRMFACEHEQVEPDLMCVAKGITGGYLPLAATFATQRIFDALPRRSMGRQDLLSRPHLHRAIPWPVPRPWHPWTCSRRTISSAK